MINGQFLAPAGFCLSRTVEAALCVAARGRHLIRPSGPPSPPGEGLCRAPYSLPCVRGGGICEANDGGVAFPAQRDGNSQSLSHGYAVPAPLTRGAFAALFRSGRRGGVVCFTATFDYPSVTLRVTAPLTRGAFAALFRSGCPGKGGPDSPPVILNRDSPKILRITACFLLRQT